MKWLAAILCSTFAVAGLGYGIWVEATARTTAAIQDAREQLKWFRELVAEQQDVIANQTRALASYQDAATDDAEAAPTAQGAPAADPPTANEPMHDLVYVAGAPLETRSAGGPPFVIDESPYVVYVPVPAYRYDAIWSPPYYGGSWGIGWCGANCPRGIGRRNALGYGAWQYGSGGAKRPNGRRTAKMAPPPAGVGRSAPASGANSHHY